MSRVTIARVLPACSASDLTGHGMWGIAPKNRVGRLRGYGNAICPQDGALFVSAYLDVTGA